MHTEAEREVEREKEKERERERVGTLLKVVYVMNPQETETKS